MKVTLGGHSFLIGTLGSATVEVPSSSSSKKSSTKCMAFVRGPMQLGYGNTMNLGDASSSANSCATGEVVFTLVRAPFAYQRKNNSNNNNEKEDEFLLARQLDLISGNAAGSSLASSTANQLALQIQESSSLLQLIRKAVDKSILKESLPLSRFELVVHVLSSCDDDGDFQCITAAACAALMDANIPLADVFGAASNSDSSNNNNNKIRMIVAAHSKSVLGMQLLSGNNNNNSSIEDLCQSVEECSNNAIAESLSAMRRAAAEKVNILVEKEKKAKKQESEKQ